MGDFAGDNGRYRRVVTILARLIVAWKMNWSSGIDTNPFTQSGFDRFPCVRLTKTHRDTIQTVDSTQSPRFGCAVERSEF